MEDRGGDDSLRLEMIVLLHARDRLDLVPIESDVSLRRPDEV